MSNQTAEGSPVATPSPEPLPQKGGSSIVPLLAVLILVPALSYVTTQFVLIPKLKATVAGASSESSQASAVEAASSTKAKKSKPEEGHAEKEQGSGEYAHSVEFGDVIVNLAGAKGTRYLRTRFTLASSDAKIEASIKANQNQLRDLAIGVLSSQTLDSLEAPGARNAIRSELISQFNHALHEELVQQLYFAEFVIQ